MYKIIGADQKEYGPVSGEQLRQWIAEGRVSGQTMVQSESDPNWRPLSTFGEFAASFATAPPSLAGQYGYGGGDTRARALSLVKGPAIFMLVTAGFGILLVILGAVTNLSGISQAQFQNTDPEVARMMTMMQGPLVVVAVAMTLVVSGFIIFGAMRMMRLQSYGLSIATSIVVMFPCLGYPCCCAFLLGIPAGIWALVVLCKPEVKSNFS